MAVEQPSMWVTLVPVIVGGVIGVVGGLAGPPLMHLLNEKAEWKRKRAEKLEEFIGVLYEHEHWLEVARNIRVIGNNATEGQSPLAKARAVQSMFFPEFDDGLRKLEMLARDYEMWMLEKAQARLRGEQRDVGDGFNEVYKPYYDQLTILMNDIKQFARRDFGRRK